MEPLLVVYDADCGVCQASVEWLRRRDRRRRFRFAGNDGELPPGVTLEETEHTVVVVEGRRKWTRGAATSRMLRELGGWALLGRLLAVPGIAWIADRGYDRFARNRHRVSAALGLTSCPAPRDPPAST
ncbi:MAG: thiol-disulfide oxidoreductase DCC family protein [Myxococcales bacterium]